MVDKSDLRTSYTQQGLSLIELLVSLLIASIVFGGVIAVVQTSRANYASEQESSFIQENARYAVELLSRDIRMAGGMGCASPGSAAVANVLGAASTTTESTLGGLLNNETSIGIEGFEGSINQAFPAAILQSNGIDEDNLAGRSDALILRYADPDPAAMVNVTGHSGTTFTVAGDHSFATGEKLVVVDASCRQVGIFQNTASGNTTIGHSQDGGYPGNCFSGLFSLDSFSCQSTASQSSILSFKPGSVIYPLRANAYFIDQSNVVPGMPALKRTSLNASGARPEELAQGVESLNFEYGIDNDDDGDLDQFITADAVENWAMVKAVRFYIVLRSRSPVFETARETTLNDVQYDDRFLRQLATGTVALRNG